MVEILSVLKNIFTLVRESNLFDDVHLFYSRLEVRFTYKKNNYVLTLKQVE